MAAFVEKLNRAGNYDECAKEQREETVSEKVGHYLSGTKAMLDVVNCIESKLGIQLPEQCSKQTTPAGIIDALKEAEITMQTVWDKLNRICSIL